MRGKGSKYLELEGGKALALIEWNSSCDKEGL